MAKVYAFIKILLVYKCRYVYLIFHSSKVITSKKTWENKKCKQCWIFESALFTFLILEMKHTLFASRELNNIQAISALQEEDRHHSNSRKFEKLWAGSSDGSSSACVESLDWNRYTLIGSKSDSSGGEMSYGIQRGEVTPSPDTYTQKYIKQ